MVDHIIIEFSKLAQKEVKTRYDWAQEKDLLRIMQEIWPFC